MYTLIRLWDNCPRYTASRRHKSAVSLSLRHFIITNYVGLISFTTVYTICNLTKRGLGVGMVARCVDPAEKRGGDHMTASTPQCTSRTSMHLNAIHELPGYLHSTTTIPANIKINTKLTSIAYRSREFSVATSLCAHIMKDKASTENRQEQQSLM
jgi:hypothetical protein